MSLSERAQQLKDAIFGVGPACGCCAAGVPDGTGSFVHFADPTALINTKSNHAAPSVRWALCAACAEDGFTLDAVPGGDGWRPIPVRPITDPLTIAAKLLGVPVDDTLALTVLGRRANPYDSADESAPPLFVGALLHGDRPKAHRDARPTDRTTTRERWAHCLQSLRDAYALALHAAEVTHTSYAPGCSLCRRSVQPAGLAWIAHPDGRVLCAGCSNEHDIAEADPSFGSALDRLVCDLAGLPAWASSGDLAASFGINPSKAPASPEPFAYLDKDRLLSSWQAEQARLHPGRPSVQR